MPNLLKVMEISFVVRSKIASLVFLNLTKTQGNNVNNLIEEYYVMEYQPDGTGSPYFMEKIWEPELPDYDIFTAPPGPSDFQSGYHLKAAASLLDGDFLISDNLVSLDFYKLCSKFSVNSIHIPVEIELCKKTNLKKAISCFSY